MISIYTLLKCSYHPSVGKVVAMLIPSFMMRNFNCQHEITYAQRHIGRVHQISRLRCSVNGSTINIVSIYVMEQFVWLHHLGFINMSDHQKGVFFDGHD